MIKIEVYPDGQLAWVGSVPCEFSSNAYVPKDGALAEAVPGAAGEALQICFLNEARMRRGRYEVLHYKLQGYRDDGPPGVDQIVEACRLIEEGLADKKQVIVYCPDDKNLPWHQSFSALCVAAHRVLIRGEGAAEAAAPWTAGAPPGPALGFYPNSWVVTTKPAPNRTLSLEACLEALALARSKGWLNVATFDSRDYRRLWHVYDLSWVVPGEIQVLGDPVSTVVDPDPATASLLEPPEGEEASDREPFDFSTRFEKDGVGLIVRLNLTSEPGLKKSYDPTVFTNRGLAFQDGSYDDTNGGTPPRQIIRNIVAKCQEIAETENGRSAVAFHCKAGFGRSMTCALVWLVYKHDIPGSVALAWSRMSRPGSITTPQQAQYVQRLNGRAAVEELLAKKGSPGEQGSCCSLL